MLCKFEVWDGCNDLFSHGGLFGDYWRDYAKEVCNGEGSNERDELRRVSAFPRLMRRVTSRSSRAPALYSPPPSPTLLIVSNDVERPDPDDGGIVNPG